MNQPGVFPWEDGARPGEDGETRDMFEEAQAADYVAPVNPEGTASGGQGAARDEAGAESIGAPFASRDRSQPRGRIARKEYYSIGEVSDLVGLPAHVLRYWEAQFPVLNPTKNRSGNRAYQRKEIRLILLVKQLLYEDKYTIEGAKARLDQLRKGGTLAGAAAVALDHGLIELLRDDVSALRRALSGSAG